MKNMNIGELFCLFDWNPLFWKVVMRIVMFVLSEAADGVLTACDASTLVKICQFLLIALVVVCVFVALTFLPRRVRRFVRVIYVLSRKKCIKRVKKIYSFVKGNSERERKMRHQYSQCVLVCVSGTSAILCAIYWQEIQCLHEFIQWCFKTPWFMCLAISWSFISLSWVYIVRRYTISSVLWFTVVAPVACFWLLAGAEHFNWATLSGIMWCLAVGAVIIFPIVKLGVKEPKIAEPDRIGRRLLYQRASEHIRRLVGAELSRGTSVAVCGPWGSGKSHFINYLAMSLRGNYVRPADEEGFAEENEIYKGCFEVCRVDLWQSRDKEAMWNDIAVSLVSSITGRNIQIVNSVRSFVVSVSQVVHIPFTPLVDAVLQLITTGVDGKSTGGGVLENRIKATGKGYILVLDNVDRCSREKIDALFPIIERLKRIKGLVTICGIAQEKLSRISEKQDFDLNQFSETLIKVFDIILPIPAISDKYALSFMRYLLYKQNGDFPHVRSWISRQDKDEKKRLKFDTPRQMENLINHFVLMENCYFQRYDRRYRNHKKGASANFQSYINASLYFAVMRVVFPAYAALMEKCENCNDLLQRTIDYLKSTPIRDSEDSLATSEDPQSQENRENSSNAYRAYSDGIMHKICEGYSSSELFKSLINVLLKIGDEELLYAVKQDYLCITDLTIKECHMVMREYERSPRSLMQIIRDKFWKSYMNDDESNIYHSMLNYCISHISNNTCQKIVEQCIDFDIVSNSGMAHEYRGLTSFLLQLMTICIRLPEKLSRYYKYPADWASNMLVKLVPCMEFDVLQEVATVLIFPSQQFSEKSFHEKEAYAAYAAFSRRMSALDASRQEEERKSFLSLVSESFAYALLSKLPWDDFDKSLAFKLFLQMWSEYKSNIMKGENTYFESDRFDDFDREFGLEVILDWQRIIVEDRESSWNDSSEWAIMSDALNSIIGKYLNEEMKHDDSIIKKMKDNIESIEKKCVELSAEVGNEENADNRLLIKKKLEQMRLMQEFLRA